MFLVVLVLLMMLMFLPAGGVGVLRRRRPPRQRRRHRHRTDQQQRRQQGHPAREFHVHYLPDVLSPIVKRPPLHLIVERRPRRFPSKTPAYPATTSHPPPCCNPGRPCPPYRHSGW